jgi:alpha-beta hydrolase superfamily lysophospholipase
MLEDSLIVFDFLTESLKFLPENIFIFGRSIGTGPATYLASKRKKCKMLILFSPFTNLKAIVKDYVSILSVFVRDRFPNIEHIKNVEAPLFILHGKKDKIVKVEHSIELHKAATTKYKHLVTREEMTHNQYRLYDDLIIPLCQFLKIIQLNKNYEVFLL